MIKLNKYKVTDLTRIDTEESSNKEDLAICSRCEVSMIKASKDITSPSGIVLVSANQLYCKQCGIIKGDATTNYAHSVSKKQEQTGPRITKRNDRRNIIFKSITYTQTRPGSKQSKLQQLFDEEDEREEERLRSQGCIIGESVSL
ncbi:MAG TPA: hypothetical protein VGE97_08390 [Nitrososphaera sp.]